MGWHCYLNDKIQFPFQATCIAPKIVWVRLLWNDG
jgi:Calcium binding